MADDLSLIVPIGAEISGLVKGVDSAKAKLDELDNRAKSIQSDHKRASADAEALLKRANILLGIQAVNGAIHAVHGVASLVRGEFEKAYESIERMPLGLGAVASGLKALVWDLSGFNDELERFRAETESQAMRERSAVIAADAEDQKAVLEQETSAILESDPLKKADLEHESAMVRIENDIAELRRRHTRDGMVQSDEFYTSLMEARINKEYALHRKRIGELQAERDMREAESARKAQEERSLAEEKAFRERIDRENAWLRDNAGDLQEESRSLAGVGASDFITSGNTSIGSFTMGQAGAAMTVARASQRQVEIQNELKEIAKRIEENIRDRNAGWN